MTPALVPIARRILVEAKALIPASIVGAVHVDVVEPEDWKGGLALRLRRGRSHREVIVAYAAEMDGLDMKTVRARIKEAFA